MSQKSEELYDKALEQLQAGDVPGGITTIEESLMEDAEDSLTWRLYSMALAGAGRQEDAAAAMKKAEDLGVDDVDSLVMKAAEAQVTGNMKAAITHFEDALELDGDRFEIWGAYSLALIEADYHTDALEASEKAVTLGPDSPQAWYARGRVLRITKDLENAHIAFQTSVKLDAKAPVAWHEFGMVQAELGKFEDAATSFQTVLDLQPGDPAANQALSAVKSQI